MAVAFDVLVVGAGPHGLATVLHLLAADPSLRHRLAVVDPAGRWLHSWNDAFARLDITHLRSPAVHHPGPDPYDLTRFAAEQHLPPGPPPYGLPVTTTFAAYCSQLTARAGVDHIVRRARVHRAVVRPTGVILDTDHGVLAARHLVVATNPHRRVLPSWLARTVPLGRHRLMHADDVDLGPLADLRGEVVVVIGGGLSAAHLALGAARRGAEAHLVARRPLSIRPFDVDPGWLGPLRLTAFREEPDWYRRLAGARAARDGGSIPSWMFDQLIPAGVHLHPGRAVVGAGQSGGLAHLVLDDGTDLRPDRLWLATGTEPALRACRILGPLADDLPMCGDFPALGTGLRVGPWPVSVTGRLAMLQLGPAAGNLWGARQAAVAIARDLTGVDLSVVVAGVSRPSGL